jgi:cysteine desulfuration protein SufE
MSLADMSPANISLAEIESDFALLDDWEDRYRYVIELGRALAPMPDVLKTDANKVRGCASQVWLATSVDRGDGGAQRLTFLGDSDAHIVRGLVAILLAIYQGKTAAEVASLDAEQVFARLGLKDHLTPQRSNGLASMVARIRADARAAAPVQ